MTHVLAIDQGTTSTRAIIFDRAGRIVAHGQRDHAQHYPAPGWVEHDPMEIWTNVREVIGLALGQGDMTASDIAAIGLTNQRETAIVWDRTTGEPVHPAIVWQDTRTQALCDELAAGSRLGTARFTELTGLPLATYFSGPKIAWILDHVPGARERAEAGELAFGTPDTWLLWNLTGGPAGGVHATDVTNASRTLLMDLRTRRWDPELAAAMRVPLAMLPEIRPSVAVHGAAHASTLLPGVPIAAILGDQQAAAFGQACFTPGTAKNTYGTGNFMLLNTGRVPVRSAHGLLTTIAYQIGDEAPVYALEGSIAVTGSLVQWLRDNLGLFERTEEVEALAASVPDNGGAYLVPAFSGLFAPYWRPDARGTVVGLTRFVTKAHLCRAALEATALQTRDVVEAMARDCGVPLTALKVDGGMTADSLLMQMQADVLGVPVVRPVVTETTALGAAYAAGVAVGVWSGLEEVAANWAEGARWEPALAADARDRWYATWQRAVERSFDWVEAGI